MVTRSGRDAAIEWDSDAPRKAGGKGERRTPAKANWLPKTLAEAKAASKRFCGGANLIPGHLIPYRPN